MGKEDNGCGGCGEPRECIQGARVDGFLEAIEAKVEAVGGDWWGGLVALAEGEGFYENITNVAFRRLARVRGALGRVHVMTEELEDNTNVLVVRRGEKEEERPALWVMEKVTTDEGDVLRFVWRKGGGQLNAADFKMDEGDDIRGGVVCFVIQAARGLDFSIDVNSAVRDRLRERYVGIFEEDSEELGYTVTYEERASNGRLSGIVGGGKSIPEDDQGPVGVGVVGEDGRGNGRKGGPGRKGDDSGRYGGGGNGRSNGRSRRG